MFIMDLKYFNKCNDISFTEDWSFSLVILDIAMIILTLSLMQVKFLLIPTLYSITDIILTLLKLSPCLNRYLFSIFIISKILKLFVIFYYINSFEIIFITSDNDNTIIDDTPPTYLEVISEDDKSLPKYNELFPS